MFSSQRSCDNTLVFGGKRVLFSMSAHTLAGRSGPWVLPDGKRDSGESREGPGEAGWAGALTVEHQWAGVQYLNHTLLTGSVLWYTQESIAEE